MNRNSLSERSGTPDESRRPQRSAISPIPLRIARELLYQLDHADQHERLRTWITSVPMLMSTSDGEVT